MSQNPLIDTGTPSSKTSGLKPALAAALVSLEVQLDQELTRYRRTRIGVRTPNQPPVANYISSQPQELTDMTATVGKTESFTAEIKTDVPTRYTPETIEENSPALTAKTQELDNPKVASNPESIKTQIPLPPLNSAGSIVPVVLKTTENKNLLQTNDTNIQPDDYLESSEALLRSLTNDEQPQTTKSSDDSNDSLLSPLGIGSMLLLLVASLTLGYVVFNPKGLPQLNFSKLFNNNSSNPKNTEEVGNNSQPQTQPEITYPKYPNLAAKEFPEVKDPKDVVGLQPKIQPTSIALPNPIVAQTPVIPPLAAPLPQVQPLTTLDLPSPSATLPKANAEITPAADGLYHLVMDNQGDRTLAAVQQVVPDAYLSKDNTLVYLGVLKTKQEAQQRLQELQAKKIKARVQQP